MANDLHGATGAGWIGFDLDGTLAEYHGWRGERNIGAPVAPMVRLIRQLHERGVEVKIVTARVSPRDQPVFGYPNPYMAESLTIENPDKMPWALQTMWGAREFIQEWCYRNLGFVPEITHEKDYRMLYLVDDRCVQVEPNTGKILGRLPPVFGGPVDKCMTKDLSLEEAIEHAVEAADRAGMHTACGRNHMQLAIWLKDYRRLLAERSAHVSLLQKH